MTEAFAFRFGPKPHQSARTNCIALDFGKRALDLGQAGGIVLQLLLEGENVAILDTRSSLQSLNRGAASGRGGTTATKRVVFAVDGIQVAVLPKEPG